MTHSHTKGPWELTSPILTPDGGGYIVAGDMQTICAMAEWNEEGEATMIFGNYEANARLIAASPCLLDAAEKAIEALQKLQAGHRDGATMGECSLALEALITALQKATGDQS